MNITPVSLKKFRADFQKAIESLEKKYDVKIDLGSIIEFRLSD